MLRTAAREIMRLPKHMQERVRLAIDALAVSPRPVGCKKLAASVDLYRVRVGDYRILYEVRDQELLIVVVKAGHRREIYR